MNKSEELIPFLHKLSHCSIDEDFCINYGVVPWEGTPGASVAMATQNTQSIKKSIKTHKHVKLT